MDSSLSIAEHNVTFWQLVKDFVIRTTERLHIGLKETRIGIVKFSTSVDEKDVFYLDWSHQFHDIEYHMQQLSFMGGNTNTSGALRFLSKYMFSDAYGARTYVEHVTVLLTDGLSNVDQQLTFVEALNTKRQGVKIFVIGK